LVGRFERGWNRPDPRPPRSAWESHGNRVAEGAEAQGGEQSDTPNRALGGVILPRVACVLCGCGSCRGLAGRGFDFSAAQSGLGFRI
jgi:hypothetical protein